MCAKKTRKNKEKEYERLILERERLEFREYKKRLKLQKQIYMREGWKQYIT
ncbi:hypothetical protein KEJ45_04415 [Candidatus Bathyarchaeota archaeon]|nr:hypothetical protein [Candidatus Bathyarchaeota archaeon]